ncbi:MAG: hypothetical protein NTV51_14620 [Verrucomicrobia bacterium]|nr:hypothetical protein [Verrucomicrobiota bacterium]
MDDDFSQLEAELKRLRPAAPPRTMVARLERELGPAEARPTSGRLTREWWFWAGTLPAAAAVAVMLLVASRNVPAKSKIAPAPLVAAAAAASEPEPAVFKPVAAENVLYAVADEGLVTLADGTAARRERLNFVDTITWKNPRTNASVRWTVPREEIRVVPVKFQ